MKTRTMFMLSLFAVGILLGGCELLRERDHEGGRPMGARGDCYQPTCDIYLTVTGSGTSCRITPDPYELHVHKAETEIFWRIRTSGFTFMPNGVAFRSGPFSNPRHGRDVYTWHDHNTGKAGPFKYRIELNDGCVLDPDVINETPQ